MLNWLLKKVKTKTKKAKKSKKIKKDRKAKKTKKTRKIKKTRKVVKKKTTVKRAKKSSKAKQVRIREVEVGIVTHYFPQVKAAVFKVKRSPLAVGDRIWLQGHTTDLKQKVMSMQIDRKSIQRARPNQEIGIQVKKRARIGDKVLLLK